MNYWGKLNLKNEAESIIKWIYNLGNGKLVIGIIISYEKNFYF